MPRVSGRVNLVLSRTRRRRRYEHATLSRSAQHRPVPTFPRHLGEMTLSMFLGMFASGLAIGLIAGAAGSSLESVRVSQPELFMLGIGSAMSVTMLAWMRQRSGIHPVNSSASGLVTLC
jgi:hypothetical protein